MKNLQKSSVEEQYKEYIFYLYLLGQIIRKRDLDLIKSEEFELLLKNLKEDINESGRKLKDLCSIKFCAICDRDIGRKKFYVCENCFSIFHQDHIKHKNPEITCESCQSPLLRTSILGHDICLSSVGRMIEKMRVSKINIQFS